MNETIHASTVFTVEPGRQEVVASRVFDAPPELVFATCTDPASLPLWWGPRELTTTVDVMEPQAGGRWRFVQRDPQGNEFAFHGVYHDVTPACVVNTFEFEGMPGHVLLETTTFEAVDGGTLMTLRVVYQSVGARDGMVASGMQHGLTESHDRLAELLAARG
jgi:uncharacterized protein YndB with AHSA1/START domain